MNKLKKITFLVNYIVQVSKKYLPRVFKALTKELFLKGKAHSMVDLLIQVACFVKKVNGIFNIKRS